MKPALSSLLLALTLPAALFAQEDTAVPRVITPPAGYTTQLDATYVKVGDWEGKMDLYLPPNHGRPTPAIIKIHGGGWNHGARQSPGGIYFHMGFALINVEYRFVQVAPAPAAIEDSRCALKYVITHARALNIDPDRIVLQGGSAGGHLVLMTGLLGNDTRFDGNCPGAAEMKVAAIVDDYGPTDFTQQSWSVISRNKSVVNWLGAKAQDESFKASVSPISYVDKHSPPVLIFHGSEDHTVPIEQSKVLEDKLKANGVMTDMVVVAGAAHGGFNREQSADEDRKIQEFLKAAGVVK